MAWIEILWKIACTVFAALVGALAIYFALRLLGKVLKIVVTVVVVIAVLLAVWWIFFKSGNGAVIASKFLSVDSVPFLHTVSGYL